MMTFQLAFVRVPPFTGGKMMVSFLMILGLLAVDAYGEELYCAKRYANTHEAYEELSLQRTSKGWLFTPGGSNQGSFEFDRCNFHRTDRKIFHCWDSTVNYASYYASSTQTL